MIDEVDLIRMKHWFEAYVGQFMTGNETVDSALRLKREHTKNVVVEICSLAASLEMNSSQCHLAEAIALLHDIGRFEQFYRYHTYSDSASVDHAVLGADIIERTGIVKMLAADEQELIRNCIANHNRIRIPAGGDLHAIDFLRLLRDADKIDILRVVTEHYAGFGRNEAITADFPDRPEVADTVIASVMQGRVVRMSDVVSLNDFKLLQVSWVYDCNFPHTFALLKKRGYIDKLAAVLPRKNRVVTAIHAAQRYLECRCREERRDCGCLIP